MLLLSRDDREHGDGVVTSTSACGSGKTVDAEYVGQGARGVCFAMGRGGGDEYGHPFRAFAKDRRSVTGGCGPTDEHGEVFETHRATKGGCRGLHGRSVVCERVGVYPHYPWGTMFHSLALSWSFVASYIMYVVHDIFSERVFVSFKSNIYISIHTC